MGRPLSREEDEKKLYRFGGRLPIGVERKNITVTDMTERLLELQVAKSRSEGIRDAVCDIGLMSMVTCKEYGLPPETPRKDWMKRVANLEEAKKSMKELLKNEKE